MRQPTTIETLYLDFDGFFASVLQQAMPALRGRPVGVIPFEMPDDRSAQSTTVIACSKEAKAAGCRNVMRVPEALALCPDLVLVPQRPDLFRRAHNALLNEIACEIPIDTVKSIDELACRLDRATIADPEGLAARIKDRLRRNIGRHITCSIGFAANRLLAKMACKLGKPDGVTIWHPEAMPAPLLALPLSDIPGVGGRMQERLASASIHTTADLYAAQPKRLRALWGNVSGERMWYALHGYDIHAEATARGMYGHGRVLPPDWRGADRAEACSRMLLTKAARRMRRDGYRASRLWLWLETREGPWTGEQSMPSVQDDHACLTALTAVWLRARSHLSLRSRIQRLGVTLGSIELAGRRQFDMLANDDAERRKWETITNAMDGLNRKFGQRVVTLGAWTPPPGGYAGGKIAYNRIPSAEDFW